MANKKRLTELERVMKMAAKLLGSGKGYHSTGRLEELRELTDRQLSNIKEPGDLVKRGFIYLNLDQYMENVQIPKEEKRIAKKESKKAPKPPAPPEAPPAGVIPVDGDIQMALDSIMKQINDGLDYSGEKSKKKNGESGFILVNASAARLERIMLSAINKHGDELVIKGLIKEYGSLSAVRKQIQRFIRAIYDEVYASWAGGKSIYEADMTAFAYAAGGTDMG